MGVSVSDCLFFGSLIATYMVYRGQSIVGPYPKDIIDVPITTVSTFVLLMSSFAMVMAWLRPAMETRSAWSSGWC